MRILSGGIVRASHDSCNNAAARPRGREPGQGAFADQFPLELGQRREDAEHEAAGRRGGVDLRALPGEHLSVSNSSSGRRWKLDHAPAVGDPTHMVEFGTGRRAFAREA